MPQGFTSSFVCYSEGELGCGFVYRLSQKRTVPNNVTLAPTTRSQIAYCFQNALQSHNKEWPSFFSREEVPRRRTDGQVSGRYLAKGDEYWNGSLTFQGREKALLY